MVFDIPRAMRSALACLNATKSPAAGRSAPSCKRTRQPIGADRVGAPIRIYRKPRGRRHERAAECPRQNCRWKDARQCPIETRKRRTISLCLLRKGSSGTMVLHLAGSKTLRHATVKGLAHLGCHPPDALPRCHSKPAIARVIGNQGRSEMFWRRSGLPPSRSDLTIKLRDKPAPGASSIPVSCYREATVARRALCYCYPAGSRRGRASVRMPISHGPGVFKRRGLSLRSAQFLLLRHHEA